VEKSGIVIIGGFLGSGKTTLLKKLLEWEFERGTRPQVIMSEFGDFDVDGAIIGDDRIDISAIVSGCICCSSRDELAYALTGMLRSAPGSLNEAGFMIPTTSFFSCGKRLETCSMAS